MIVVHVLVHHHQHNHVYYHKYINQKNVHVDVHQLHQMQQNVFHHKYMYQKNVHVVVHQYQMQQNVLSEECSCGCPSIPNATECIAPQIYVSELCSCGCTQGIVGEACIHNGVVKDNTKISKNCSCVIDIKYLKRGSCIIKSTDGVDNCFNIPPISRFEPWIVYFARVGMWTTIKQGEICCGSRRSTWNEGLRY
eukprot:541588_1